MLTGSHIDTVASADATTARSGVLSALAALRVRAMRASGHPRESVEMVALCEEEDSRFHGNFWGTRGILGLIEPAELDELRRRGRRQRSARPCAPLASMPERFARGDPRPTWTRSSSCTSNRAASCSTSSVPLGIVDTITGLYRFRVTVEGRTDHAGTTPMDLRRDALAGRGADRPRDDAMVAAGRPPGGGHQRLVGRAARRLEHRARAGAFLGRSAPPGRSRQAAPGGPRIRAARRADRRERGVGISYEVAGDVLPKAMDPTVKAELQAAAEACGVAWKPMVSGAGHDSQVMATGVPTACCSCRA